MHNYTCVAHKWVQHFFEKFVTNFTLIHTHTLSHAGWTQKLLKSRKMRNWVSVDGILWHEQRVCVCVCVCVCFCEWISALCVCVSQCVLCVCVCVCVCVHCAKDVCVRTFMCVGSRYKFLTHLPVWVWNYWIDASIPSKRHLQTCSFYFIPLFILCPVYWPVFPACNHRLLEALPFSNSANVSSLLSHSEHYRLQMFPHEKRWYILFLPGALHVCTLARP